jgi:hypothetical protein
MTSVLYEGTEKVQYLIKAVVSSLDFQLPFYFIILLSNVCRWYPSDFKSRISYLSPFMVLYDIVVPKDNMLRKINELVDF